MEALKYKVIKTRAQYDKYCILLEGLLDSGSESKAVNDEIELLTVLIEKWDQDHNTFKDLDPVEMLWHLMQDHKLKSVDMATLIGVSEGLISDILNYKKGFSKATIRILSQRFKMSQEAFNRPYRLDTPANASPKPSASAKQGKKPIVKLPDDPSPPVELKKTAKVPVRREII